MIAGEVVEGWKSSISLSPHEIMNFSRRSFEVLTVTPVSSVAHEQSGSEAQDPT
jgi:hypothetical protein